MHVLPSSTLALFFSFLTNSFSLTPCMNWSLCYPCSSLLFSQAYRYMFATFCFFSGATLTQHSVNLISLQPDVRLRLLFYTYFYSSYFVYLFPLHFRFVIAFCHSYLCHFRWMYFSIFFLPHIWVAALPTLPLLFFLGTCTEIVTIFGSFFLGVLLAYSCLYFSAIKIFIPLFFSAATCNVGTISIGQVVYFVAQFVISWPLIGLYKRWDFLRWVGDHGGRNLAHTSRIKIYSCLFLRLPAVFSGE